MAHSGTMDLTRGSPLRQILLFSLPLVAGTLLQQFYVFVDTAMVGRILGEQALAAVGTTHSLNFLTLGFVQGACVGFGIPLAQSFGAKDDGQYKRYFFNGVLICVVMSVLMTAAMLLLASPMLRLMRTPEDIFDQTLTYMLVIFAGIPASVLYNFCAGALRAAGDSRHPFVFLLISSLLNIALDYILIVPIPMGVMGAALATVISQFVSGLLNLYWLACRTELLKGGSAFWTPSGKHIRRLCVVGFPMGFEYSISALGAVVMQSAINMLGSVAVAGQTAGEKIRQMFTLPMESVGMGMATYAGQNDGAGRPDRIRAGIKAGLTIQWTYCVAAWVVIFLLKRPLSEMVLGSGATEELALSVQYLGIISTLFCIHGALMIMRNTLQGMGYSAQAVLSGVGELIGRSVGGMLSVAALGFVGICLANPMAWGLALIYCSLRVHHFLGVRLREQGNN